MGQGGSLLPREPTSMVRVKSAETFTEMSSLQNRAIAKG